MNYETIFFDVGNTLFFFNYDFLRDLLKERFGISVMSDELEEKHLIMKQSLISDGLLGKISHDELWWEVYRRWFKSIGVEQEKIDEVAKAVYDHPFSHMFWSRMEEGTKEMLDWFRGRGLKLGIISNAEGQIKKLIEYSGLLDHFETVIDSKVVGVAKPDPKIFKMALASAGAVAESSVYVGDYFDIDVVGARSVGMTPILVDPDGIAHRHDCLKVARVSELPKHKIFEYLK